MNRKLHRNFLGGLPESLSYIYYWVPRKASRKLPGSLQGTLREPPGSPQEVSRKLLWSTQEAPKDSSEWNRFMKKFTMLKKFGFIRGKYKLISSLRIHVSASIWALFSVNEIKLYRINLNQKHFFLTWILASVNPIFMASSSLERNNKKMRTWWQ